MERRGVKDAVMGILGAGPGDEDEMMARKTTYFGSEIRRRLKDLGVVKDSGGKYGDIIRDIEKGVSIAELIRKVGE